MEKGAKWFCGLLDDVPPKAVDISGLRVARRPCTGKRVLDIDPPAKEVLFGQNVVVEPIRVSSNGKTKKKAQPQPKPHIGAPEDALDIAAPGPVLKRPSAKRPRRSNVVIADCNVKLGCSKPSA